jgi:hypothetical protein
MVGSDSETQKLKGKAEIPTHSSFRIPCWTSILTALGGFLLNTLFGSEP